LSSHNLSASLPNQGSSYHFPFASNIRMCPHISVFAPEFNFRDLRSGLKVQGKMMYKDMHKIVFQSN
jgi:hypothetical protein